MINYRASLLALTLSAIVGTGMIGSTSAAPLVELYTSQGCSSCPPADALMNELSERDDVVALSFHVDYWDRLGWPDTLGSPAWSARQRDLARNRGDGRVYTPQAVVANRIAVGSDRGRVARLAASNALDLDAALSGGGLRVTLPRGQAGRLFAVRFSKSDRVDIGRGENRGRTITYNHSVRGMTPLSDWSGAAGTLDFEAPELGADEGLAVVVLDRRGVAQGAAYAAR